MKFAKVISVLGALSLAAALSACLNDSGSSRREGDATLTISTTTRDVNKVQGLGKSAVISLRKLVITLRSSDSSDAVRRDTVLADTGASFHSTATADQIFTRSYALKPLRNWTVVVKTLDAKDSVIHYDSTVANNLLAGETRSVPLVLSSRYVMYEAQFTVPDSLHFTAADIAQQLSISRVVMRINGVIVTDSTTSPRFTPSTTTPPVVVVHTVRFDYIRTNQTPDMAIEFYGRLGADSTTKKLFETKFDDVDPTDPNPPSKLPDYVGPGSPDLLATAGLQITIGKVGTVVFVTNINGSLPKNGSK